MLCCVVGHKALLLVILRNGSAGNQHHSNTVLCDACQHKISGLPNQTPHRTQTQTERNGMLYAICSRGISYLWWIARCCMLMMCVDSAQIPSPVRWQLSPSCTESVLWYVNIRLCLSCVSLRPPLSSTSSNYSAGKQMIMFESARPGIDWPQHATDKHHRSSIHPSIHSCDVIWNINDICSVSSQSICTTLRRAVCVVSCLSVTKVLPPELSDGITAYAPKQHTHVMLNEPRGIVGNGSVMATHQSENQASKHTIPQPIRQTYWHSFARPSSTHERTNERIVMQNVHARDCHTCVAKCTNMSVGDG